MAFALPPALSNLVSMTHKRVFVVSIGDEAVVVTLIAGSKVVNAWVAAPEPADGADDVLAALATVRNAPVLVLMDAFEQVFREEKVPKVNFLDQKKVIDRHLQMAFPGNNLQAAVSQGADPKGNRFYLFCSVPPTPQVKGWLTVLENARRKPRGIHMLPLESLDMLERLTPPAAQKGVRWRILFTFNMTGGLRQVVTKQGRIQVTRLTHPPPPDSTVGPVQILERQFHETLTYVKRMGYQKGDNLDVVVLADGGLADAIREREWEAHSLTVISPHKVGESLGFGPIGKPGQPYSDVVHALWLATRKRPRAKLSWAQAPKVDYAALIGRAAPTLAVLGVVALVVTAASLGMSWWQATQQVSMQQARLAQAEAEHAFQRQRLEALPYGADEIRPLVELVDRLTAENVPPRPLLARLGHALGGSAVITEISVTPPPPAAAPTRASRRSAATSQANTQANWRMTLTVRLPVETSDDADALRRADVLHEALSAAFPDRTVTLAQSPVAVGEDQILRGGRTMATVAEDPAERQPRRAYSVVFDVAREAGS